MVPRLLLVDDPGLGRQSRHRGGPAAEAFLGGVRRGRCQSGETESQCRDSEETDFRFGTHAHSPE
jgi:hypothetical protein